MRSTYDTKGFSSRFQLPCPKTNYEKTACFRAPLIPYYNPSLEYFIKG